MRSSQKDDKSWWSCCWCSTSWLCCRPVLVGQCELMVWLVDVCLSSKTEIFWASCVTVSCWRVLSRDESSHTICSHWPARCKHFEGLDQFHGWATKCFLKWMDQMEHRGHLLMTRRFCNFHRLSWARLEVPVRSLAHLCVGCSQLKVLTERNKLELNW